MRLAHATTGRRRKPRRGLSLLEVILSLAILVLSITAIGTLINLGTEHEMEARLSNAAARLAQSKLAEVEAGFEALEDGNGTFESDPEWNWEKKAEDQGANLWLVTVTVSRTARGRPFQYSLGQMMLDASALGSASKATRPTADTATTGGGSP